MAKIILLKDKILERIKRLEARRAVLIRNLNELDAMELPNNLDCKWKCIEIGNYYMEYECQTCGKILALDIEDNISDVACQEEHSNET